MNNVDTTKNITHLSLCTGYEGIGLGLKRVLPTLREIAYVEIEAYAIFNLAKKIEQGWLSKAPIYTNLKTFPFGEFRGKVDILSGGFPCQPFSVAGSKKATEDPRHLFPYIAEGIKQCQPRIVWLENVSGIITQKTKDGEPVLKYVLRQLEGLGYRATAGCFTAEEVGLPHRRERIFILGISNSFSGGGLENQWSSESAESYENGQRGRFDKLSDTECSRMHGGRSSEACGAEGLKLQGNEGERYSVRSEVKGCDSASSELGYTEHDGLPTEQELRSSSEASDHNSEGENWTKQLEGASRSPYDQSIFRCKAVARANEAQHEWEEPRVVGDSEGTRLKSLFDRQEEVEPWGTGTRYARSIADEMEAQSKLGRTIDGTACRVDSLRLLGNGVVPATCAKAFVTLINQLCE
jgi:DNA (cytosine-5)-methyltransferase 1